MKNRLHAGELWLITYRPCYVKTFISWIYVLTTFQDPKPWIPQSQPITSFQESIKLSSYK